MELPLKFGNNEFLPVVRTAHYIKNVLYDKNNNTDENSPVYYIYRGIYANELDRNIMDKHHIRYDNTFVLPGIIGQEFHKTAGHYHPLVPGTSVTYPEMYQVMKGTACYVLQKVENSIVKDFVIIYASEGDIVLIPPGYGHITINETSSTLKMANWICSDFSSVYEPMEKRGGGAYYNLINGRFVKNPLYSEVPPIRFVRPPDLRRLFGVKKTVYELIDRPEMLAFLVKPQHHQNMFDFMLGEVIG